MASGSSPHLPTELFQSMTGTKVVHVPYSGGGPAAVGVMGNNVQMLFSSILPVLGWCSGGQLKPIAIAADRRSPLLPDVPTFTEGGVDYRSGTWFGLLAPAKTPADIIATLNRKRSRCCRSPRCAPASRSRAPRWSPTRRTNSAPSSRRDGRLGAVIRNVENPARLRTVMTELNGKKLTGRIAADRIRMTSTPKPPKGAVERFLALGECTSLISDVMDELGIAEGAIGAQC